MLAPSSGSAPCQALGAEVVLVRVILTKQSRYRCHADLVGRTGRQSRNLKIDEVVGKLTQQGVKASGEVRIGEVTFGIVKAASRFESGFTFCRHDRQ